MEIEKIIENLKKSIEESVKRRLKKFEKGKDLSIEEKFVELCFCILVANSSMEKTFKIWKRIGNEFLKLSEEQLSQRLRELGYRFYNKRAEYIVEARNKINLLEKILKTKNEFEVREKLVENFRGIGWKEASHFLRNIGYKNFAIIDRHVLRTLKDFRIVEKIPKSLNKKTYLDIEDKLREMANKLKISLAELDFYLFYISSGKIPIK
ncbi:MAG: N-glycosylase/DNA lyase [Candidatus Aenigmarchaeota archaeon]|jgi:N-glycosylase/DNA lyase|nr:N-glycosylase/DNA lyase [Candidatus Aenigmarchaeota archaeon]